MVIIADHNGQTAIFETIHDFITRRIDVHVTYTRPYKGEQKIGPAAEMGIHVTEEYADEFLRMIKGK